MGEREGGQNRERWERKGAQRERGKGERGKEGGERRDGRECERGGR